MSEIRKELGKIAKSRFGYGGYQDAQLGLSLEFTGDGFGVGHFDGFWSPRMWTEHCKWSKEDQIKAFGELLVRVDKLLTDAKVDYVAQLEGKPVMLEFEGNMLKSFRILTEVL